MPLLSQSAENSNFTNVRPRGKKLSRGWMSWCKRPKGEFTLNHPFNFAVCCIYVFLVELWTEILCYEAGPAVFICFHVLLEATLSMLYNFRYQILKIEIPIKNGLHNFDNVLKSTYRNWTTTTSHGIVPTEFCGPLLITYLGLIS